MLKSRALQLFSYLCDEAVRSGGSGVGQKFVRVSSGHRQRLRVSALAVIMRRLLQWVQKESPQLAAPSARAIGQPRLRIRVSESVVPKIIVVVVAAAVKRGLC